MPEAKPASEPCSEKGEIVQSIKAAMGQVLFLHRLEVEAIEKGDVERLKRIEDDLRKGMRFKASLLERYQSHLQAHGCK